MDEGRASGQGRKVLVTGGAGFIGANLCRALLRDGYSVECLDNLYSGSMDNIEELLGDERFSFREQDVCEYIDTDAELIYHLACPASPPYYQKDPIFTARTCFEGALSVLKAAKRNNARVLFTSTSEVYGDPLEHPQRESYRGNVNPDGIRACYDEGKRIAETLLFDHSRMYGTDIAVVRIFNTYGPFMQPDDGRVVSNFIMQALKNEPLTIYGSGDQTRSFCYVDDTVKALMLVMGTEGFKGPVNIGNDAEITVGELAERIIEITGSASETVCRELPKDDPARRRPDLTLIKSITGWSPETPLDEGLSATASYFRGKLRDKGSK